MVTEAVLHRREYRPALRFCRPLLFVLEQKSLKTPRTVGYKINNTYTPPGLSGCLSELQSFGDTFREDVYLLSDIIELGGTSPVSNNVSCPGIMTQLLKIIHTPRCEQFQVGTTFFCGRIYLNWTETELKLLTKRSVFTLLWVTRSWFLDKDIAVEFFKCIFWRLWAQQD